MGSKLVGSEICSALFLGALRLVSAIAFVVDDRRKALKYSLTLLRGKQIKLNFSVCGGKQERCVCGGGGGEEMTLWTSFVHLRLLGETFLVVFLVFCVNTDDMGAS